VENPEVTRLRPGHSQASLPELLIEAYLDGNPELKGNNNSEGLDTQGIFIKMSFDPDMAPYYQAFIEAEDVITVRELSRPRRPLTGHREPGRAGQRNVRRHYASLAI
jgi:hypothetical protein